MLSNLIMSCDKPIGLFGADELVLADDELAAEDVDLADDVNFDW